MFAGAHQHHPGPRPARPATAAPAAPRCARAGRSSRRAACPSDQHARRRRAQLEEQLHVDLAAEPRAPSSAARPSAVATMLTNTTAVGAGALPGRTSASRSCAGAPGSGTSGERGIARNLPGRWPRRDRHRLGPNGPSATIALAQAGRSVVVLEAPRARRRRRDRGAAAARVPPRHVSGVYPAAPPRRCSRGLPLDRHGLRGGTRASAWRIRSPDGSAAVLARDLGETAALLDRLHPGDGDRWAASRSRTCAGSARSGRTMLGGFPPLRGPAELLLRAGPRAHAEARARAADAGTGAGARAVPIRARRARGCYGSALHGDVPLAASGSAITAVYLHCFGHGHGWPSPKGGAGRLADALVGMLAELGGEVRCGQPVIRVVVERGRAAGVELRGRRARRRADRDRRRDAAWASERLGGPAGPPRRRPAPLPLRAADAEGRLGARRPDPVDRAGGARGWDRPRGGREGGVRRCCGQQSIADPSRAPAGKHTAWAYTHGPHTVDWDARPTRTWSGWSGRSSASRPGSATGSSPATCSRPPTSSARDANLVRGDVGAGSLRARPARSSARSPALSPVPDADPRAVPRQRRHVPGRRRCTACPATRRPEACARARSADESRR